MPPEDLIDSMLDREGRTCPGCSHPDALTSKDVHGTDDWAMGEVWCPRCGFSLTVCIDADGQWHNSGPDIRDGEGEK